MGKRIKKVQELDIFWRRVILFSVIFVLAVPLTALIAMRFTKRAANFDTGVIIREFEMDSELGESLLQIQETTQELQNQFNKTATTTTSTDEFLFATSTEF